MTNAAGRRILQMWYAGTLTRAQLDNAYYIKGWISDEDYAQATQPVIEPATEG